MKKRMDVGLGMIGEFLDNFRNNVRAVEMVAQSTFGRFVGLLGAGEAGEGPTAVCA